MKPQIILRVPENIKITGLLNHTIQSVLIDQFMIEPYSQNHSLLKSYQQRIHSLFEAFDFLCEAIPPGKEELVKIQPYIDWCRQYCQFTQDTLTAELYQKQLIDYTTLLINAVVNLWKLNTTHSINLLDKAEQYLLLQKPRPTIATLVKMNPENAKLALIVDRPLTPFTQETLAELKQIKSSNRANPHLANLKNPNPTGALNDLDGEDVDESYDKVDPHNWFSCLPETEKKLLFHALQTINLDDPNLALHLSSRLRTIPGLANLAQYQAHLLDETTGEIKTFEPKLRSSHLASRDVMQYSQAIHELHTQRNVDRLLEYVSQNELSTAHPLLIQTLISPVRFNNPDHWLEIQRQSALVYAKSKRQQPIYSTNHPFNYARIVISTPSTSPECLQILKTAQDYLKAMQASQDPALKTINILNELVTTYDQTLNSGLGTAWATDYNGRELFLSSLEDLLISSMHGISYGSCVSGKDRKAIQLIHTTAMLFFHEQYGYWPKYTDLTSSTDRKNFVQIFTQLYCSHHSQIFSGQNAPGSDGIKNPNTYLPADIRVAIQIDRLIEDDRLASNNEVEKTVSKNNILPHYPRCLVAAKRLSTSNIEKLFRLLAIIVNEVNFWASNTTPNVLTAASSYLPTLFKKISLDTREPSHTMLPTEAKHSLPDAITKIRDILYEPLKNSENEHMTLIKTLADIYNVILQRDETNLFRRKTTQSFYDMIESLIDLPDAEQEMNDLFDITIFNLRELKKAAFDFNQTKSLTTPSLTSHA